MIKSVAKSVPRTATLLGWAALVVCGGFLLTNPASAQDGERRIVAEPLRALAPLKRVSASNTPSGLPVPRYVSLKAGRANGRTGPSRDHAVAWQYTQRGLPVIVVAETERWRRVRDHRGDESWMLGSLLSGERRALTKEALSVHRKPDVGSRLRARVGAGLVVGLESCEAGWCEVDVPGADGERHRGWALQVKLWGAQPL